MIYYFGNTHLFSQILPLRKLFVLLCRYIFVFLSKTLHIVPPTIASLLPHRERLMSGDRATENARLWGRILEQCAAMRTCNTTSSIASSTYRRLVRRLRPHNCEAHLTPLVGMIFVKWE